MTRRFLARCALGALLLLTGASHGQSVPSAPASGVKPLYLRSAPGLGISRVPPTADGPVVLTAGTAVAFDLPPLALDVTLPAGPITAAIWLRRQGSATQRRVRITLSNSATGTIGTTTQTFDAPGSGPPVLVDFVLDHAATTTFPAGSTFSLNVVQEVPASVRFSTLLFPTGPGSPSQVRLDSATVVNVDSVTTYDAPYPGGSPQTRFLPGATVYVRAAVSDPFGSFDIASAALSLEDSGGMPILVSAPMALVADDGLATRTYESSYTLDPGATPGAWTARVTAVEGTEGTVTHTGLAGFVVLSTLPTLYVTKTVTILTDPLNGAVNPKHIPGSVQEYRVTVRNTGPGAVDASTLVVADTVPPGMMLYVSAASGDPIRFLDGVAPSGLAFAYSTDVTYTNLPGGAPPFSYTPVPDALGFDGNVTALRVAPNGAMNGASSGLEPEFSIVFRVRLP